MVSENPAEWLETRQSSATASVPAIRHHLLISLGIFRSAAHLEAMLVLNFVERQGTFLASDQQEESLTHKDARASTRQAEHVRSLPLFAPAAQRCLALVAPEHASS